MFNLNEFRQIHVFLSFRKRVSNRFVSSNNDDHELMQRNRDRGVRSCYMNHVSSCTYTAIPTWKRPLCKLRTSSASVSVVQKCYRMYKNKPYIEQNALGSRSRGQKNATSCTGSLILAAHGESLELVGSDFVLNGVAGWIVASLVGTPTEYTSGPLYADDASSYQGQSETKLSSFLEFPFLSFHCRWCSLTLVYLLLLLLPPPLPFVGG